MDSYASPPSAGLDPNLICEAPAVVNSEHAIQVLDGLKRIFIAIFGSCVGIGRACNADAKLEAWGSDESTLGRPTENNDRDSWTNTLISLSDLDSNSRHSSTTSIDTDHISDAEARRREHNDYDVTELFFYLAGKTYFNATINKQGRVLCVGNGVAAWALEVARKFPSLDVVILEKEPFTRYLPNNCTILKGTLTGCPGTNSWDYIYIRNDRGTDNSVAYFEHIRGLVRPGGQVEIVDVDNICTCQAPNHWRKARICNTCVNVPTATTRRSFMENAGFCKLIVLHHGRYWRTKNGTKVCSIVVMGTRKKDTSIEAGLWYR